MPILSFFAHLLITAALLLLVGALVPGIKVQGCAMALWGALVLSLLNLAVEAVIGGGWSQL